MEIKTEADRICSLCSIALIKREVKATFNRMLKVPGFPLPVEDALELRRDCPPGCQHCAPFPSQIINEIKVQGIHFLACLSFSCWCFCGLFVCLGFFLRKCSGHEEVAVGSA